MKAKITILSDLIQRYKADETGATGIEYALIASLVGILGVSSAGFIGENLSGTFEEIGNAVSGEGTFNPSDEPPVDRPSLNIRVSVE